MLIPAIHAFWTRITRNFRIRYAEMSPSLSQLQHNDLSSGQIIVFQPPVEALSKNPWERLLSLQRLYSFNDTSAHADLTFTTDRQ